jgi:hypothetical protein
MKFKATVELIVEADDDPDACDAVWHLLEQAIQDRSLINWGYADLAPNPVPYDGDGSEFEPEEL